MSHKDSERIGDKQIGDKDIDKQNGDEQNGDKDIDKQNGDKDIDAILKHIDNKLTMVLRTDYNKTTDKEWFLNSNIAYQVLRHVHHIPKKPLLFQFIQHILDVLTHDEKLELTRHFFKEKEDFVSDLDMDSDLSEDIATIDKPSIIKHYLILRMNLDRLESNQKAFLLVTHEKKNTMYTWSTEDGWKPSSVVEQEDDTNQSWLDEFNKQDALLERMHKEGLDQSESDIGFMDLSKKTEQDGYGFKLKNVQQKKNNLGARCSEADKQSIIQKVNRFLTLVKRDKEVYESDPVFDTKEQTVVSKKDIIAKHSEGSKKISKKVASKLKIEPVERVHLCIIYEILMRYHTLKENTPYIFSLEETIQSKVSNVVVDKKKNGNKENFYYMKK